MLLLQWIWQARDDRAGSGAVRKLAMHAARECAQQLLLPPSAGIYGGTRSLWAREPLSRSFGASW